MLLEQGIELIKAKADTLATERFKNVDRVMLAEMSIKDIAMAAYVDGMSDAMDLLLDYLKEEVENPKNTIDA